MTFEANPFHKKATLRIHVDSVGNRTEVITLLGIEIRIGNNKFVRTIFKV